jgi:hypothetical protein
MKTNYKKLFLDHIAEQDGEVDMGYDSDGNFIVDAITNKVWVVQTQEHGETMNDFWSSAYFYLMEREQQEISA